jgi:hypothetical protein
MARRHYPNQRIAAGLELVSGGMRTRVGVVLLLALACAAAMPSVASAAPPVSLAPPAIDDTTPVVGETLNAGGDAWDDPGSTVAYQWLRCASACAEIPDATGAAYTVVADDVGSALQVRAIATNADGPSVPSDSDRTSPVPDVAPQNAAPPSITGKPQTGEQLTAEPGTWDGTRLAVSRQWLRCDANGDGCVPIHGAQASTWTLGGSDVGHAIRVSETAANGAGTVTATSSPTAAVTDPPKNTAPPTITGTPRAGQTLTAHQGTWSGTAPTITRRWRSCDERGFNCTDIPGATGTTLVVGTALQGHTIRVRETATNALGSRAADSDPTAVVPTPPFASSPPLIAGTPVLGATLVSTIGNWNGTFPIMLSRRWQRCDPSACTDIAGATSDTYQVQTADLSKSIRLVVLASNEAGTVTAASAFVGPVTGGAPATASPPRASTAGTSTAPTVLAAFNGLRRDSLVTALAGRYNVLAACTGPCRLRARLVTSKAVARKWRVPRTIAAGTRNLIAAGKATVRPKFAEKTRKRLKRVQKLVVKVVAEARDSSGTLVARRSFKVTLIRTAVTTRGTF